MASIRQRGKSWFAEVRYKGTHERKSFKSQAAAKAWARKVEASVDDGSWIDTRGSRSAGMNGLVDNFILSFERFGLEVAKPKLGQLNQIKEFFDDKSLHNLTVEDVLDFAAHRRKTVCASTLQDQMYYLKQVIQHSRIRTNEPVVDIAIDELKKKKIIMGSIRRERRLEEGEYEALMDEAGDHWIGLAIDLALVSAMRQGEIHRLKMSDVDFERGTITLLRKDKKAETGQSEQKIPIVKGVREVLLRAQNEIGQRDRVFQVKHAASISDRFARMTDKIGIEDLRFHDLRHEAISRMFERGMRVEQVRVVSGHRTLDQLSRYVNLRPENLSGL